MQSRQEMKLTLGAEPFLAPGETVVRSLVAVAKGATHHAAGTPTADRRRPTRALRGPVCAWRRRSGSS